MAPWKTSVRCTDNGIIVAASGHVFRFFFSSSSLAEECVVVEYLFRGVDILWPYVITCLWDIYASVKSPSSSPCGVNIEMHWILKWCFTREWSVYLKRTCKGRQGERGKGWWYVIRYKIFNIRDNTDTLYVEIQ